MSITATQQDPRLASIRQLAGQKDDGIPFLLLPVRLETRFMTVDRPRYPYPFQDRILDLLTYWWRVRDKIRDLSALDRMEEPMIRARMDGVLGDLGEGSAILRSLAELPRPNRRWIEDTMEDVGTSLRAFYTWSEKRDWSSGDVADDIARTRKALKEQWRATLQAREETPLAEETRYSEAAEIVAELNKLEREIKKLNAKDFTVSKVVARKGFSRDKTRSGRGALYPYVDAKLSSIQTAYTAVSVRLRNNFDATITQIQSIARLQAGIQTAASQLVHKPQGMRSAYMKQAYEIRFKDLA
ncbi:MAG: hypothetical protein D6722_05895 [Bacteroidetes bacterium]|nr:MAG: hypothetical protein D6722_05895 [Bacteroidota bacterium]